MASMGKEQLKTIYKEADLWSLIPIEFQMRGMYTHNLFCKFQREMQQKTYTCVTLEDGMYKLVSLRGYLQKYGERDYNVHADKDAGTYSCNCCKFERDGVLCCHLLRVMEHIGVYEIPQRYVLRRWTWDSEDDLIRPDLE